MPASSELPAASAERLQQRRRYAHHKARMNARIHWLFVGRWTAMSIRSTVPALLWWLFWLLVALILIILAALVIHHFGGFDLTFHIGDFHFDLGVTGQR
jgi:hypothetical protein